MIFRQLFDSVSCTYTYLIASRHGGTSCSVLPRRAFPGPFICAIMASEIFPALSDGALPQSQNRQPASGASGNVTLFDGQTA
jgi:hypothetical protein